MQLAEENKKASNTVYTVAYLAQWEHFREPIFTKLCFVWFTDLQIVYSNYLY